MNKNFFIGILVLIILYVLLNNKLEKFTFREMKNYPQMLDINCTKSKDVYKKLLKKNEVRCNLSVLSTID